MSMDQLRAVLDRLEEASCCSGTHVVPERIAIALPDGDVGAVDDPGFVDWLVAHAEPAPFGDGTKTKIDPKVRAAKRLVARGAATVHGFEPAAILETIEATLSPGVHLDAHLTDVIVYEKGGKFARHRDTPRSEELIGTLVVGLPVEHAGGAFHVDDGRGPQVFDWSGKPKRDAVQWVALFSDVDHEIKPVTKGARVTLVYALHRTDRPRSDAAWLKRQEQIKQACRSLSVPAWPLMIACGRHVIAEPGAPQPQGIETLRGTDRDIAEALVEAGYRVAVRACIAPVPDYDDPPRPEPGGFPTGTHLFAITRLKAVPSAELMTTLGHDEGSEIEDLMLDSIMMEQWLIRKHAAATLAQEHGMWSETGYFGNEGYDALLYTLAALEVTKAKPSARSKKVATKQPAKKAVAKQVVAKKAVLKKPVKKAKKK
jgi:hypothetical protein